MRGWQARHTAPVELQALNVTEFRPVRAQLGGSVNLLGSRPRLDTHFDGAEVEVIPMTSLCKRRRIVPLPHASTPRKK
jgi:hypothetical protein